VAVVGTAPTRRWVHQWNDAQHCCGENPALHFTYEVILNEGSNVIELVYQRMEGARVQFVGLENHSGSEGIGGCPDGAFSCAPPTGHAVRFVPTF
jgi:hypothetical protein